MLLLGAAPTNYNVSADLEEGVVCLPDDQYVARLGRAFATVSATEVLMLADCMYLDNTPVPHVAMLGLHVRKADLREAARRGGCLAAALWWLCRPAIFLLCGRPISLQPERTTFVDDI